MEAEQILGLFDSLWFELVIFKNKSFSSNSQNPVCEINQIQEEKEKQSKSPISIHVRSMSEDLSSKLSFISSSPSPKLQTIHSSKDMEELSEDKKTEQKTESKKKRGRGRGRRHGYGSKSLSELEFEEVKGFMDLGFVFCEEDKNSTLASIIPGLNRLGKREEEEDEEKPFVAGDDECGISRPYLSEAWEEMEREKEEKPTPLMMNWRFAGLDLRNEIDMKDNLRWWAHSVASTVR